MKIIKQIPAVKTFDVPAGTFKAKLTQCKLMTKQSKRGPQEWVRLIFEIRVPGMENQIPMAGRNFPLDLNPGSDLRNLLEVWLGNDFFKERSNQNLDFDTLLGKEGDIVLSHYQGDDFEKPLVIIDNIFSATTLKLTEAKSVAPTVEVAPLAKTGDPNI